MIGEQGFGLMIIRQTDYRLVRAINDSGCLMRALAALVEKRERVMRPAEVQAHYDLSVEREVMTRTCFVSSHRRVIETAAHILKTTWRGQYVALNQLHTHGRREQGMYNPNTGERLERLPAYNAVIAQYEVIGAHSHFICVESPLFDPCPGLELGRCLSRRYYMMRR